MNIPFSPPPSSSLFKVSAMLKFVYLCFNFGFEKVNLDNSN
ncbi:unnamed protein product [Cuscuta epithymum]|uniref:Uncharacterized protein n=1 Tax=Cuscuta epithymum TaxID=186058 RepID=A0AAV0CFU7_9ASTE|nr:unnamed protein product [Cuscuta epithymum]